MSVALKTDEPLLSRHDADGVAWLTMNRPAARNALSVGLMAALEAELDAPVGRSVHVVVIAGAGPAFCAGHDLREIRGNPSREAYGRSSSNAAADAEDRPLAQAGDRPSPRRRHRRRLPAGRELRSRHCRRRRAVRHAGGEHRAVLLDADGRAVAGGGAQVGDGDAADRRTDRRRDGDGDRARQPRRAGGRADAATHALARQIAAKSAR